MTESLEDLIIRPDLQLEGLNALSTWEMRSAGGNSNFGDGDDVVYTLSVSASSRSATLRVTDGPLQPGTYRLSARAVGLLDRFSNPLDGDGNGSGGDDFAQQFSVAIPNGSVLESRSNNSIAAATPLPMSEDPAGSGFWTSAIALGAIDPVGESDYWSFEAQKNDQLIIDMESPLQNADLWVLSRTTKDSTDAEIERLIKALSSLYFQSYISEWQGFLDSIEVAGR